MKITVKSIKRTENTGMMKVLAFVDIVIDGALVITGLKVVDGEKGMFVGMPREKGKDEKYYNIVYTIDTNLKKQIDEVVLEAYNDLRTP